MTIDFYYTPGSPGCRLVHLVAAALDLDLNLKLIDYQTGEHRKPEFLKINPQHTIPTIVDDGFPVWESRAISRYLIAKTDEDSTLYPKDLKARSIIDQRVDFDIGTLYPRYSDYFYPQLTGKPADEALLKKLEETLEILNTFLEGQKFVAGSDLTLADLALVVTVSTIDAAGISLESFPNATTWYELIKTTAPKYDAANGNDVEMLRGVFSRIKP